MATLPSASTTLEESGAAVATGSELLCVIAPVSKNADVTPRVMASTDAILDQHDYCEAAELAALFYRGTRKPLMLVGVPIVTQGVISREDSSGNSGTSVVSVAAGVAGPLAEVDGRVRVVRGGTIGTDQIALELSLDGGRTYKSLRLGTANSYVIPNSGLTLSFGAGTLKDGETVKTWHASGPRMDQAGLQAAREALAAQQKQSRSWLIIGDLQVEQDATDLETEVEAYHTANERNTLARAQVRDRLPQASMSKLTVRMTGSPTLTFATASDTIARSAGSWIDDGFVADDTITVTGTASNDGDYTIVSVTASTLTLVENLTDEGPVADVTVTGSPTITFAEVGATGDTITRSRGSWLTDGFRPGDDFTTSGTASNDGTTTAGIDTVTASTITLDTDDLAAETIRADEISIVAGETMSAWVSDVDAEFSDIDDSPRVDLAIGRARVRSPITGYLMRRPIQWAAAIREFQHDLHVPTWRKDDGPLQGWDLEDAEGNTVEFDQRIHGGGLEARFTCARSWANGPAGTFIALSLTRATDNALLSRTHNMNVANVACNVAHKTTEDSIGQFLEIKDDGSGQATKASLNKIKARVDSALKIALLQDVKNEGARASGASWTPNPSSVLNVPGATLTGEVALLINGTIEKIATAVKVQ